MKGKTMNKQTVIAAINGALVSRGKLKGSIKKKCPPMGTDSAAAWQALIANANPYKLGIGHVLFFDDRQRWIFDQIEKALQGFDINDLDRDANALRKLGVM